MRTIQLGCLALAVLMCAAVLAVIRLTMGG